MVLGAVFIYTQFLGKEGAPSKDPEDPHIPIVTTIITPLPHVPVSDTLKLTLAIDQDLKSVLIQNVRTSFQRGSSTRILIRTKEADQFMSLGELLNALDIIFPPSILSKLEDNFTFIIYAETDGTNKIILISKLKSERDMPEVQNLLRFWEQTMEKDLDTLLFLTGKKKGKSNLLFLDNFYKQIAIRYLNFDDPTITLDYAVVPQKNLLLFTTSRESMYTVIDLAHTEIAPE